MRVYNPASGRWFILHWWTDHDRGHLTFTKTLEGLLSAARVVFTKEPGAECRGLFEIEMVAPSRRMEKLAAEHDRKDEVNQFYCEVAGRVTEAMDAGLPVPAPFSRCDKFEPEDEDEDESSDEWSVERHYGCKNCDLRLKLTVTRDELYARYAERWRVENPPHKYKPGRGAPVRVRSTAPRAFDDEEVWFALADFGHHARGIELKKTDLSDAESFRPACLSDRVLFFYRLIRELTPEAEEISRVIAEIKAADDERRARAEEWHRTARAAEVRKRVEDTVRFFTTAPGGTPSSATAAR